MVIESAMKTLSFKRKKSMIAALAVGIVCLTHSPNADADYLYWGKGPLTTGSLKNGYDFAVQALRAENAANIRRSEVEVSGSIGRNYVAITCVGTTPRVTAVVMVIGPDGAEVARVRQSVQKRIAGITRID
jgi:hypothetical protein